jgi:glycosyltransferase involved in cell wall biosynthesis
MSSDSPRPASKYDIAILTLFDPKITAGGAQQCAYDLFLNFKKYTNLRVCFISATSPITKLKPKANAFIRRSSNYDDEFYFFTGEYDYFWHCCKDSRPPKDLALFLEKINPRSIFISHYMHIGIDLISMIRAVLPKSIISVGLHEMLFACMADGQMVKKTDGQLCHKSDPQLCSMCFPEISADAFAARKKFNKECLEQADNFIFPSKHLAGVFSEELNISPQRIHVINHPIDLTAYQAKQQNTFAANRPVRFGYFGQFLDNKGVDVLLKAGAELDTLRPNRRFEIIINGGNKEFASKGYQSIIEALISESKNWRNGSIVELGGYSHNELISRMDRVDFVVVPSTWPEVFALVVTEAFACFKPVLAARIGGLAERLKDGIDGFNFQPRNPSDLAQKMHQCLALSDATYRQMCSEAYISAMRLNPKRALQEYAKALDLNLNFSDQLAAGAK